MEVNRLLITPAAIGYLAQLILSTAITLTLAELTRRARRLPAPPLHLALLTAFFITFTVFIALLFFDAALMSPWLIYVIALESICTALALVLLLQFAYHFPRLDPAKKWEARGVLALSLLYALVEVGDALYHFAQPNPALVRLRPLLYDVVLGLGFIWAPGVFLRQSVFASEAADAPGWPARLWRPRGRAALAARALALVFLIPLGLSLVNLLRDARLVSGAVYQASLSLGLLVVLFAFASVYINALPEMISFVVKLGGMMLTVVLIVLSLVGWITILDRVVDYRPQLADEQTLRFTPNASGGYTVAPAPFQFETDLGDPLALPRAGPLNGAALAFDFPFYGVPHTQVYATDVGAVSLGRLLTFDDLLDGYSTTPAIFLLGTELFIDGGGGLFARDAGDRLIITWFKVPAYYHRQAFFTVQLVLYHTGDFDMTFNGLPADFAFTPDDHPSANLWMLGALPGNSPANPPQRIEQFNLPLSGGAPGFVQDHYLAYRYYLHRNFASLALLILISSGLILVGFPLILHRSLVQPLNQLIQGVARVEQGDLTVVVAAHADDEIGYLSDSFSRMVASLRQAERDLRALNAALDQRATDRTRDLQTLYEITELTNESVSLSLTLERVLANILNVMDDPCGLIHLLDEDGKTLRLAAQHGFTPQLMDGSAAWSPADLALERVLHAGQPVVIPDFSAQLPPPAAAWLAARPACLGVPIQVKDKKLGVLSIFNPAVPPPAAEKIALLSAIGYQIGITVETARLRERGERAAVLEERQRLARDLHDSVTQSLYGVTLFVQASRGSLQTGDLALTRQHIEQLSETAQQALKEMRLLIFQLRPSLLEQVGLIGALQQRLAVVEQRAGVETRFQVEGALELPAALENDLYQIAQEALNNVLKHAAATRVALRLSMDERALHLAIEDNGHGFDPQAVRATAGIGLASMRERAQRIGAQLAIESSSNTGTRVRLTLPGGNRELEETR